MSAIAEEQGDVEMPARGTTEVDAVSDALKVFKASVEERRAFAAREQESRERAENERFKREAEDRERQE